MKTKKIVIAVLTAALVAAFIIGCMAPMEGASGVVGGKAQPASAGKTRVRLNLMNLNSRTVKPDTNSYTTLDDFENFSLTIFDKALGLGTGDVTLDPPFDDKFDTADMASGIVVELEVGKTFVFIFSGYDNTDVEIARGVTELAVTTTDTVSITLKEIVDGDSDGIFEWDLDLEFDNPLAAGKLAYGTAHLSLFNKANSDVLDVDLLDSNDTGTEAIPSGYYKMVITLGLTNYQTVYVQESVHIYGGFTSEYAATLPNLRSTLHRLIYNTAGSTGIYTDSANAIHNTPQDINHGSVIFDVMTHKKPVHSSDPTNIVFGKWYRTSTLTSGSELLANDLMIKPITLYASWVDLDAVNITITPALGYAPDFDPQIITDKAGKFDHSEASFEIEATVGNDGGYDTFDWYRDITLTEKLSGDKTGFIFDYTLNATNVDWWQAGDHFIYVLISDSAGVLPPQSARFIINCSITP